MILTSNSTTAPKIMFQMRDKEEPVFLYSKEQPEDELSISASEEDGFISEKRQRLTQTCFKPWNMLLLKYLLAAAIWIISVFLAVYVSGQKRHNWESLSEVLPTELQSVQSAIELQQVRFSGTLEFDDNSTLISTYWDPEALRYTGEPSDELDARWHALIHPDGVDLRGNDASSIQGKTFEKPGGWSIVSIDVFHQLHCLNMLRQAIRPDYYTRHDPEPTYTTHIHHCIDHIRQALMCHVDVTPIPVLWAEKEDRPLNDFQVEHTCRNFWKVKEWALGRDARKHDYRDN